MKLTLKNIGKIGTASVEINGITVIAGENNTGKSTVGKALYCLFTAFHNINDKIVEERSLSIYRAISAPFRKRRANILMAPNGLRRIAEEICKNRTRYFYTSAKYDAPIALSNISTGFKTFLILKTLLMNGAIEEGGTIILDEPEIHLHPEWQLVFAELIVLIHKEFGIHVLLNTHSPYFLNAIEVYAVKHGIDDKCKYYLASSNAEVSNIEDVTNNIEAIYSKLARPLQDLENERGQL